MLFYIPFGEVSAWINPNFLEAEGSWKLLLVHKRLSRIFSVSELSGPISGVVREFEIALTVSTVLHCRGSQGLS